MKKLLLSILAALAVVAPAGADAQKGGPITVLSGGKGVVSPDGSTRYVAIPTGRHTLLSAVRVGGGQVVRWRLVPGYVGIPVVAADGTTEGLSRDSRTLVLVGVPEARRNDEPVTRLALVDTRTLKLRRLSLPGTWAYDAVSPDGSLLYLIEYERFDSSPTYRVRAYDIAARRLLARPIVDREIGERLMRGWAVTRVTTPEGRWAYTLYARARKEPFVHALDTVGRRAFCIDLPLELTRAEQMTLRLVLRGDRLAVHRRGKTVAFVDTRSFVVHRHQPGS
jgi:hypothetical protein